MPTLFLRNLKHHREVFAVLDALDAPVAQAAGLMSRSLAGGGKIMFCGNGGSAADSQHLAAELTGRLMHDRRPLAALALPTNAPALTCIGNDYDFEQIFARQVSALGRPGDCLVVISTSGNSGNVVAAARVARAAGITVVGLLGGGGGQLRALCDGAVVVSSEHTARIQEAHILIGHTLCGMIEIALGLGPPGSP